MAAMRGTSVWIAILATATACGTGDNRVDPSDLELRDLLGIAPEAAATWNVGERAGARRVLGAALAEVADGAPARATSALDDPSITSALSSIDGARADHDLDALAAITVSADRGSIVVAAQQAPAAAAQVSAGSTSTVARDLAIDGDWGPLADRPTDITATLATDLAGSQTVMVVPSARLPVIAALIADEHPRLLVNPVVIAAFDPEPTLAMTRSGSGSSSTPISAQPAAIANSAGNPYSFYGSYEECAAAQEDRCNACLPSSSCTPITNATDGNTECMTLAGSNGRGYFLECINLALAISAVQSCTQGAAPGCAEDTQAADSLSSLSNNADFLDNSTCGAGLDKCLATIYGAPPQPFPGADAGSAAPQPVPPRSTSVSCDKSCDTKTDDNCSGSPNCNCSGPSCNNSLSCDSACSGGDGKGCSGASCSSSSGSGGGGCSSGSGSGGGGCGGSGGGCAGCTDSGCSGSSGSSSNSGCGSCGSGSNGCGSGGGSACNSGQCDVAGIDNRASYALAGSIVWSLAPIPIAAGLRRRVRRRKQEVKS
jgi:hypothetical protein